MRRLLPALAAIVALIVATTAFASPNSTTRFAYYTVKTPVERGLQAHVVVDAGPAGLCRITVSKDGIQMRAERVNRWHLGLYAKRSTQANDYRVAWTWIVGPDTRLGLWRVRVDCGQAGVLQKTFRVVRSYG